MPAKEIERCVVLYVEDYDAIAYLFQMALGKTGLAPQVFRVTDGEQATAFLCQVGLYESAPRPNLVLLDLNLPRKSGFDVLAEMKGNPRLHDIPVVVFSSSKLQYDRERALNLGAEDYLNKDTDFDGLVDAAESVCKRLTAGTVIPDKAGDGPLANDV